MKRLFVFLAILIANGNVSAFSAGDNSPPRFSDYTVDIYRGPLKVPAYYKKEDGEWRDDMGKLVENPEINFAGKYHIGIHSCGSECRYYTLSNLENGRDSNALDMFSNDGVHSEKTTDGRFYITSLISRRNSRMLVAQYHIEQSAAAKEKCRERIFVLIEDGKTAKPITNTLKSCKDFQ